MMNRILIVFLSLAVMVFQANAEESIVIDSRMLTEQSGSAATINSEQGAASQAPDPGNSPEAEANRERLLKGGKMSARQRAAVAKAELSLVNKQEGENFLAENKAKNGVISLPSGVQYLVHRTGRGKKPIESNNIVCRYTGTLIDGTLIDFTEGDAPVSVPISSFIPGMREAVKLMAVGSKWQVVVPPHLAYGEKGDRGIGPNAVLIYEIEITGIK